jgi:hypothetical protein
MPDIGWADTPRTWGHSSCDRHTPEVWQTGRGRPLRHLRTLRGRTPPRPVPRSGREPPVRAASPGPTGRDGRPAAPFGRAREGETAPWHRAASRSGAEGPPATSSRPSTTWHRPPHRPDVLREGRCALWAGVSFGRAGVRSACTVPHTVPASFGRHTWAGVTCREAVSPTPNPRRRNNQGYPRTHDR